MPATFRDLIADNKRKSALLLAFFFLFTVFVAMVLGFAIVVMLDPGGAVSVNWWTGIGAGILAAAISLVIMTFAYYQGDRMVLAVSGAKPLEKKDDPQLYNVVEEMAIAAGVPMPSVYLIDDSAPNAFATGRDPQHAAVTVTTGLRAKLNREELQGVVAHEMSHVRNYDIRLMMLMAVLIGSIVMLSDFFWQILRFGGAGRQRSGSSSDNRRDNGQGIWMIVIVVLAVLLALIAPILAQIIQLAVSRQREFLADASGVELTRNPLGLASALRKIDADPDVLEGANRGTAHLYISNPVKTFEARASSLFSSHPPIAERIARLEALAK
jgi:heat shock protein HtpX